MREFFSFMKEMAREHKIITSVVIAIIAIGIIGSFASYNNANEYTGTVVDKEVKRGEDSSKYLIFIELDNGETRVLENTDVLFAGKFNSSDLYGQIKIGERYTFKTIGFRLPALSLYENIFEIQ